MAMYVDPNRLFKLDLPQRFRRDDKAESLVFVHDDFDGRVNIACFRAEDGAPSPDLFESLPSRDMMENVLKSKRGDLALGYGDYIGNFQDEEIAWRWWTIQRGPVCVVVSYNGRPDNDDEARGAVDELIAGIEVTERPPLSVDKFTAMAALAYAQVMSAPAPEVRRPLELGTGPNSILRLDNAYVTYLSAHDDGEIDAEKLLKDWFERLWGEKYDKLSSFEEMRSLIYPVLKPCQFARDVDVNVLRRPLLEGDLDILMAIDTGRTLRFVSQQDLASWPGVTEDEVFFYARENLLALCKDMQVNALANQDGKPAAIIFASGDGYDASKLILPDLYQKLSALLGPDLLVGVPNRDFMIVLSAHDDEMVARVSEQVRLDAQQRPYAISGELYRFGASGLERNAPTPG
ncbi:MAG: DUF1444 family protein [Planctomycetes bacterium]|nr:DUF1444 family protein [Planctomycetota bacterium]